MVSFHLPDIQCDAATGTKSRLAKEQALVHPRILAVLGSLKLGGATEIHATLAAHLDYAAVTYMDAYAVIGTDAIDGFNLGTAVTLHLVICTAGKDLTLDVGTLECTAGDWYYGTGALAGITYCESLA